MPQTIGCDTTEPWTAENSRLTLKQAALPYTADNIKRQLIGALTFLNQGPLALLDFEARVSGIELLAHGIVVSLAAEEMSQGRV